MSKKTPYEKYYEDHTKPSTIQGLLGGGLGVAGGVMTGIQELDHIGTPGKYLPMFLAKNPQLLNSLKLGGGAGLLLGGAGYGLSKLMGDDEREVAKAQLLKALNGG